MENFTPVASLIGGMLIGLSASVMLLFNGKIAGISGIVAGILTPRRNDVAWRTVFVGGLLAGGLLLGSLSSEVFDIGIRRSWAAIIAAGVLVGYGARLGSGCTSGHGVCGLSRFSARSLVATLTFMITAATVVYVVNHLLGGAV